MNKNDHIKLIIALISFFLVGFSIAQGDSNRIIFPGFEFEIDSVERLYGDNVALRKKADKESSAVDTLSIGEKVTILQKTKETIEINGLNSFWYKVRSKSGTGYIAGGLIAKDSKTIGSDTYLLIYAGGDREDYGATVRCRLLASDGDFYGHEFSVNTSAFYIEAFDDRGIQGINNMLKINLFAEACGVDGGEVYLFNDGTKLIKTLELSQVSDGGVFWFREEIKFPDEAYWGENTLVYEREFGEMINEDLQITRAVNHTLPIVWENGAFTPDINTLELDEDLESQEE